MNRFTPALVLSLALFPWSAPEGKAAEAPPPVAAPVVDETARIGALIAHIEALPGASFMRNGKTYDAATAAKFLRGKWDAQKDKVRTARDFIDQIATKSSATGLPYSIRLADGRTVPCRDELLKKLDEIEKAGK